MSGCVELIGEDEPRVRGYCRFQVPVKGSGPQPRMPAHAAAPPDGTAPQNTQPTPQVLRLDEKADRPFRDAGQEVSAPLMATGDDSREQAAQTVGEPAGMADPAAMVPHLVNVLETGGDWTAYSRLPNVTAEP